MNIDTAACKLASFLEKLSDNRVNRLSSVRTRKRAPQTVSLLFQNSATSSGY